MSAPREVKTAAVVIRRARFKEADRVITLFTRELGKVSAVAKGVRKSTSKLAGHLETLTYTEITLARGKNLDTIIGSQTLSPYLGIRNSLERSAYALYFSELTDLFSAEGQPNQSLFSLLTESLGALGTVPNPELLARYFELNLLKAFGYRPELRRCLGCGAELQATENLFSPAAGGTLCPNCGDLATAYPVSVSGLKAMRFLLENRGDAALRLKLEPALNREISAIIRAYTFFLLEKSPRSARWLEELRTMLGTG